MTERGYWQRFAHVLGAVGLAVSLLAIAPMAEGLYGRLRLSGFGAGRPEPGREPAHAFAARANEGDLIARLKVVRLGLDVAVLEGVRSSTLAVAPGHVPGTALPGDGKSTREAIIAIPRDSPAARVSTLQLGDRFEMRTPYGARQFRVVERRILSSGEFASGRVSRRGARGRVLLVTPYPADSAGPAPSRLGILGERA